MASRRQLLETKQALVDAAFRQAEQQLLSLPEAEYIKLCAQLADQLERRQCLLAERQRCIDLAFEQAASQLRTLPQEQYVQVLAHIAAETGTGSEELIFCAEDRERVGQAVVEQANALLQKAGKAAKLTLSAETRPMRGGVVLKDGLVETNCSIGTMISGLRPALSGKVAACLFG